MKFFCRFLVLGCLLTTIGEVHAQLEVMTYNLRLATDRDGENAWSKRKEDVAALIDYYHPTVFGVQEALHEQMTYLNETLEGYNFIGVGRDDGATKGEYSAIFYDATKLKVISSETFWLSETPNKPSYGWGVSYRRICTYGQFIDLSSGDTINIFNAHFDHEVKLARLNAAKLILEMIRKKGLQGHPIILTGDFNCTTSDPPIIELKSALSLGIAISETPFYGPHSTFNGFGKELECNKLIDHVFVHNLKVTSYRHVDDRRPNGLWPSDHLPVLVTVSLK